MDRIEKMVQQGTISVSWIEYRVNLVFEPDEDAVFWIKRTTILIKRDSVQDALEALFVYLNDPIRAADDFPLLFFDPASHLMDYND